MTRPQNIPPKPRSNLPVEIIRGTIKRLSKRLAADDQETDAAKRLSHKEITAMSLAIEKLCKLLIVSDRRPDTGQFVKNSQRDAAKEIWDR